MDVEMTHDWNSDVWDWPLQSKDEVVRVNNTHDKWEVGLDASYFTPKEIEVKVHRDNIIVHLEHEARTDQYGDVKREVTRTYKLPEDVDRGSIKSRMDRRGVLQISASKKR
ncbi:small heat shock protein 12.6identical [Aphelenchoides avenae]|nr:small heat shock protein 12.6identical [Aphelenchus avenae]KAH7716534.1 small heat shock protein 12.6identical [Aphelenchus avenae]KAH7716547.1 small heat shock protein 12.6identical [Aphelenchus avenae]